ncbi:YSC84-related protein [Thioalkalivibrio sp. XN279]|uniref:lipid-binding SYLF domain-containing protein n=1 Tax=Thioalkalivibrio sp. XN279 TaxID=2714953 RepID=UPI001407EC60|nr:YSC84-related protein [Thioalkalivibrio sp. XN279]NHA15603.1 twin-arginine translocation pathway signal [Thioalkalivibrio sp. XN279]
MSISKRAFVAAVVAVLAFGAGCTTTTGNGADPAARRAAIDTGVGALRVDGKTTAYHATTSGSWGFQAGAQSTAVFMLFMTEEALTRFQNSSGWTVGADASVTMISVGASASVSTATAQQPVIGFVLSNRGLMAGISLNGARITRLDL